MPKLQHFIIPVLFLLLVAPPSSHACGYSFIGECSSSIHLRINNTLDSFNVAECSFGKNFSGLDLGNIQSLNLARASAITWESCINNVTSVALYYRVYEQGMPSGSWKNLALMEDYNTLVGPYTARYRSKYSNDNLTTGLIVGKTYVMQIYFLAQVDTIGDDFIPETTMLQNNNGQNFQLTFEYGGTEAPPFTVVPTSVVDEKCPGDETGSVGVTVYGNQNGLFYQWSNVNNNFNTLYNLAAGTYTVTVSGANGYTQSQSVMVHQPAPISITFPVVQDVICGNTPGSAHAVAHGGTAPYSYLWETGEPDSTATIPLPGIWQVSVTDANGCSESAAVQVGGSSTLEQTLSKVICQGNAFILDGHSFTTQGVYDVLVPGNGSCDTLFHLTINTLNPAIALTNLPDTADLSCNNPIITLCAANITATTYEWKRLDVSVSSAACITINNSAAYTAFATTQQSGQSCIATKTIQVNSHLSAPQVQVNGIASSDCNSTQASILLTASTNALNPVFSWTWNGNIISTADTCSIQVENPANFTPPMLLVTDAYGCQGTNSSISLIIHPPVGAPSVTSDATPASGMQVSDGAIHLDITGGSGPYSILWDNGSTGSSLTQLVPGQYCYTVSDASGCMASGCAEVGMVNSTEHVTISAVTYYPNPLKSGNTLHINLTDFNKEAVLLELYNLQGQMVGKEILQDATGNMELHLPVMNQPGQYLIRLQTDQYSGTFFLTIL